MKLNTLNDIQNRYGFHNLQQYSECIPKNQMINKIVEGGTELAIFPSQLKAEAVNWIKRFNQYFEHRHYSTKRKGTQINNFMRHDGDFDLYPPDELMYWIIHFFNITTEELK
jgi:hypothetical protein